MIVLKLYRILDFMCTLRLLAVCALCFGSHAVYAQAQKQLTIEFERTLTQGALVLAHTNASTIEVLNRKLIPDSAGTLVFGLGRDAPEKLAIKLHDAKGGGRLVDVSVTQRRYQTQEITGVDKKYVSPPQDVLKRIRRENSQIAKARSVRSNYDYFKSSFLRPAAGPITGVYGSQRIFNGVPKRPHFGLDIAGKIGTPVLAPAEGIVTLVHSNMFYSGGTLIMDHGRGISSTFIHLSKIHVEVGKHVKQGDLIAEIGETGRATGPHLDWRVNWFNHRLDPALLLSAEMLETDTNNQSTP